MSSIENWVTAIFAATGISVGGFAFWIAIQIAGIFGALGFISLLAFAGGVLLTGDE